MDYRRTWRAVWRDITAPPHMKPIYAVVYLLTVMVGVVTLVVPPNSIAGEIGPVLSAIWAWCFIAGGVAGLAALLAGWWWLERLALITATVGGVGIYGFVITWLHFASQSGSRLTQLGVLSLAALVYVVRGAMIPTYSYEPRLDREE